MLVPALLFVFVLAAHLASPGVVIADSKTSVYVAAELVNHGDLRLDRYAAVLGNGYATYSHDGHAVPFFPWAPSLCVVPFIWARDLAHLLLPGHVAAFHAVTLSVRDSWHAQVQAMCVVVAACSVVLHAIARRLLVGLSPRRRACGSAGVALAFAFCTSAWSTADRSLWQHGPSMLCLSLAVLLALRASQSPDGRKGDLVGTGAAVAAAFTMRPTNGLSVLVLTVWALLVFRLRVIWYLAGAAGVAAGWLAVNVANYGTPLPSYYRSSELGRPANGVPLHFWQAMAGNVVSPARGLFVFTPVLLLAVAGVVVLLRRRAMTALYAALGSCVLLHWVTISLFAQWWGGNSYGPRLFSDMVPYLVVLSVPAVGELLSPARLPSRRRMPRGLLWSGTAVLVLASFTAHAEGALTRSGSCWNSVPVGIDSKPSRLWDWQDAQVTAGIRGVLAGEPHEFDRAALLRYGCDR